jgi:putative colanic acid biosynthesis acetyltransferase WcaF
MKGNESLRLGSISKKNKILRLVWNVVRTLLFRPTPISFHKWRCFLLRLFGANIGKNALPYPTAKIWAPWNLVMEDGSCISHNVDCYCVDKITIGRCSTVSQRTFLCTASHDYSEKLVPLPLLTAPIKIGQYSWVTSEVFIGPGVSIGDGAIVTARSVVFKNVSPWEVVGGHPAKFIKMRRLNKADYENS